MLARYGPALGCFPLVALFACSPRFIEAERAAEPFELDAQNLDRQLALQVCYDGPALEWTSGATPTLDLLPDATTTFEDLSLEVVVGELEPQVLALEDSAQVRVPYDQSIFEDGGGCAPPVVIDLVLVGDVGTRTVSFAPVARMSMDYMIDGGSFTPLADDAVDLQFVEP